MGLLCAGDGAISFSVPCFTVLTGASCGAAAGIYLADLLRVVTGLLALRQAANTRTSEDALCCFDFAHRTAPAHAF